MNSHFVRSWRLSIIVVAVLALLMVQELGIRAAVYVELEPFCFIVCLPD
ncbi:MAG: hypothetical protein WD406_12235 [Pseudohongiellaceae bacterium]